jgi:transposase
MKELDARKWAPQVLELVRRHALDLRSQGYPWAEIARICGVHVNTVLKWSRRAKEEGVECAVRGYRRGRRVGTGRKLTLVQEVHLRSVIVGQKPAELDLGLALWNRHVVQRAIQRLYGIDMPIRTVGEYLRRWGFTPRRPLRQTLERNPALMQRWLDESYQRIAERAKRGGATICWGDETAVRNDWDLVRGGPPAPLPSDLTFPARHRGSITLVSAITNHGLVRFRCFDGALDAGRFLVFLGALTQDAGRKVFLIVDDRDVHRDQRVTDWVQAHASRIELFHLPPGDPERNANG